MAIDDSAKPEQSGSGRRVWTGKFSVAMVFG